MMTTNVRNMRSIVTAASSAVLVALLAIIVMLSAVSGVSADDSTTTTNYETTNRTMPDMIVQFGTPRTATTLQFQILCLIATMLHGEKDEKVACDHVPGGDSPLPNAKQMMRDGHFPVIKSHIHANDLLDDLGVFNKKKQSKLMEEYPNGIWLFRTGKRDTEKIDWMKLEDKVSSPVVSLKYVQSLETLGRDGIHGILDDYARIFRLSAHELTELSEYIRYWTILRQCCGKQMSVDWRKMLQKHTRDGHAIHNHKRSMHDPNYHACEMYNIKWVERLLLQSEFLMHFKENEGKNAQLYRVSNVDGTLNGNYCEVCEKYIEQNPSKAGMNKNCYYAKFDKAE